MNKRILLSVFVLLVFVAGCSGKQEDVRVKYEHTFRMAEAHPINHPTTIADYEFVRRVEEETEGRIKIILFSNKELGEEREVIEQVGFGAIDFTRVSIAPLSETVEELKVLQLPYLYKDSDHMWRVLNGEIGDYFLDKVKDEGFVGLCWFDGGVRSFYTRDKPIRTLDDLKGQNIRVMESSLMLDMIEALGANGIMLSYGQVYSSLQTGDIDGAENNFASFVTASHLEVAKYYSVDEHVRVPEIIVASEKVFAKISLEDQEIIKRVAKDITEYQKDLWEKRDLELKQVILDAGVEIYYIEDKTEFIKAVEPIYDNYPEFEELIQQIKNQ